MARTPGARNHDCEEARLALARKVRDRVMAGAGVRSSLREMAAAAGASVTTLRHDFGDREGCCTR
jgi:AcrR family transcriptional regulator